MIPGMPANPFRFGVSYNWSAGLGKARQFSEQAAPFVRTVASQAKNPYVLGPALLVAGGALAWRKLGKIRQEGLRSAVGRAWEQGKKWMQQIPLGKMIKAGKKAQKAAARLQKSQKALQELKTAKSRKDAHQNYLLIRNHAWESADAFRTIAPFRKWIPDFYFKTVSQTAEKADEYRKKALSLRLASQWDQKG